MAGEEGRRRKEGNLRGQVVEKRSRSKTRKGESSGILVIRNNDLFCELDNFKINLKIDTYIIYVKQKLITK